MEPPHGHRALLPFDTDEPQFARGFEMGRLWALLRERPHEALEEYARAENAEMIMRVAEATRRPARSEELQDGWLLVQFGVAAEEEID